MGTKFDRSVLRSSNSSPTSSNAGWMQTAVIVGAVLLGFAFLAWTDGGDDNPPQPETNVEQMAETATRDYAASLGVAFESLAAAVAKGDIENPEQLQANAQEFTKAARTRAFRVLDELDNANIPAGSWDSARREQVAAYLTAKAIGHRRAAR